MHAIICVLSNTDISTSNYSLTQLYQAVYGCPRYTQPRAPTYMADCMFIQAPITLKEWQKRDEEAGAEQDAAQ